MHLIYLHNLILLALTGLTLQPWIFIIGKLYFINYALYK
uniref:Uncharacterized protein n=1 Tax=Rheinheimera sp. BAL341 TaxID=1708203 RepID=A0A486XUX3_9GAMM